MTPSTHVPSHSPSRRLIEGRGTAEGAWRSSSTLERFAVCDVVEWTERFRSIWLLAPHPDDEVLALGGSMAQLTASHAELHIVSVTDGEASHAGSSEWTAQRLAKTRPLEMRRSLEVLGIDAQVLRLGIPDGRVGAHRETLLKALVERVDERDLLLATCRFDGHPDHEACGEVGALAAELTGATLFEYPVWMWHWASPDEVVVPWTRAQQIVLPAATIDRKRAAIDEFRSQITPDGGREAVLPPHVLPRFLRPFEVVFT